MKTASVSRRKVVAVGAGAVGATFAYALASSGLTDEIVLIDQNESLAQGQVLDLVHGQPFFPTVSIHVGCPADYTDAQLIVLTIIDYKGATCFAVGLALVAPKQFCRIECSKVVWSNKERGGQVSYGTEARLARPNLRRL